MMYQDSPLARLYCILTLKLYTKCYMKRYDFGLISIVTQTPVINFWISSVLQCYVFHAFCNMVSRKSTVFWYMFRKLSVEQNLVYCGQIPILLRHKYIWFKDKWLYHKTGWLSSCYGRAHPDWSYTSWNSFYKLKC